MDNKYHHPMTSSWMMDLPIQIEQARKIIFRTKFMQNILKKMNKL